MPRVFFTMSLEQLIICNGIFSRSTESIGSEPRLVISLDTSRHPS